MQLSVQLYTLRDPLSADFEGTLEKVAATGLKYVELAGTQGRSADEWSAILGRLDLKPSGAHMGLGDFEEGFENSVGFMKNLGVPYVGVAYVGEDLYRDGWDKLGKERFEPAARKAAEAGLQFFYHNHAFEFALQDGQPGLDVLYGSTEPSLVKAELDLAWVSIGGADPAEYLRKLAGRVPLAHFKDYDPNQKPQWRPVGEGILDWDAIIPAAKEAGVEFAVIELDESPGDPIEAVQKSVAFFKSKGL